MLQDSQQRPSKPCCDKEGTNDPDVQQLWDLMAEGHSQVEASRIVWGGGDA